MSTLSISALSGWAGDAHQMCLEKLHSDIVLPTVHALHMQGLTPSGFGALDVIPSGSSAGQEGPSCTSPYKPVWGVNVCSGYLHCDDPLCMRA